MALDLRDAPTDLLDPAELEIWRTIPTAVISDDLNRTGAMVSAIKPVAPGLTFAGQALTIRAFVGDNAAPHYGLTKAWPGCVIVVDARGHTETAIWGGLLHYAAKARGAAAVIIDGAIRDVAELRESGLPAYARANVPNGPQKAWGGGVNVSIQCGGVAVNPGDILVGDDDGVVVFAAAQRHDLLKKCQARIAKETDILRQIDAGKSTVEIMEMPAPDQLG
mgnify:CR=1 FL=1